MKTIMTLLFSFGIFATSFAQHSHQTSGRDDRYVYNEQGHFDRRNAYSERQFQINKINREYNFKIHAIMSDYTLLLHQKKVAIRGAESERVRQIHMLNARYARMHSRHGHYQ